MLYIIIAWYYLTYICSYESLSKVCVRYNKAVDSAKQLVSEVLSISCMISMIFFLYFDIFNIFFSTST